ncbi:MAG: YqjF family protein [Acidimicrobiales bacterium]
MSLDACEADRSSSPSRPVKSGHAGWLGSDGSWPAIVEPVTAEPEPATRRPVLRQSWAELAYFHWPYAPSEVQDLLPSGLQVDTFDGQAWVGLIPFEMQQVRVASSPVVPWLGSFLEINVRTYVVDEVGRRAVWFFSLDVPRSAVVTVARTMFGLPYCWSHASHSTEGNQHRYQMNRRWPRHDPASADMSFTVGAAIPNAELTDFDHFLTARWALITQRRGRLQYGGVNHPRWPLHRVEDVQIDQSALEAAGLSSPNGKPHSLYSPGVDVEIAWLEAVGHG